MTLTLSEKTAARLIEAAEMNGTQPDALANSILDDALLVFPDDYEAVQEGVKAIAEGRERPAEEFFREHESKYPSNLK